LHIGLYLDGAGLQVHAHATARCLGKRLEGGVLDVAGQYLLQAARAGFAL
jgi:hypothetical protein